jgi:hypothetical protein
MIGWIRHFAGTTTHKFWVARNISLFIIDDFLEGCSPMSDDWDWRLWLDLAQRAVVHDLSKYSPDEAAAFAATSHRLRETEYGSAEYRGLLRVIKPAIERHYSRNSHHPEHHRNGIKGMSTADLIEMVADWGAAVRRHADGDLDRSIVQNADRFDYDRDTELRLRGIAMRMRLL